MIVIVNVMSEGEVEVRAPTGYGRGMLGMFGGGKGISYIEVDDEW